MDFLEQQYKDKIREIPMSEQNKIKKQRKKKNDGSSQPVGIRMIKIEETYLDPRQNPNNYISGFNTF